MERIERERTELEFIQENNANVNISENVFETFEKSNVSETYDISTILDYLHSVLDNNASIEETIVAIILILLEYFIREKIKTIFNIALKKCNNKIKVQELVNNNTGGTNRPNPINNTGGNNRPNPMSINSVLNNTSNNQASASSSHNTLNTTYNVSMTNPMSINSVLNNTSNNQASVISSHNPSDTTDNVSMTNTTPAIINQPPILHSHTIHQNDMSIINSLNVRPPHITSLIQPVPVVDETGHVETGEDIVIVLEGCIKPIVEYRILHNMRLDSVIKGKNIGLTINNVKFTTLKLKMLEHIKNHQNICPQQAKTCLLGSIVN
jgi:hypothetical protein